MADDFLTKDRGDADVDLAAKETSAGKLTPRSLLTKDDGLTDINPATEEKQDAGNASLASLVSALADPATQTTLAAVLAALGSPFQAGGSIGNTSFAATQSGSWTVGVSGTVTVSGTFWQATQPVSGVSLPLPSGAATESTLAAQSAKLPAALGSTADSGSLSVAQSTEGKAAIGATNEAAPGSDTASSGLNGRLQRIAQNLTTFFGVKVTAITALATGGSGVIGWLSQIWNELQTRLPATLGIKTAANSLSVAPASDGVFQVSGSTGTPTSISGSIATGGTAQNAASSNSTRKGYLLQNLSTGDLWFSTLATAVADQPSIKLPAGAYFESPLGAAGTGAISIIGATTGQKWAGREW